MTVSPMKESAYPPLKQVMDLLIALPDRRVWMYLSFRRRWKCG